jgi:hypothetical protein
MAPPLTGKSLILHQPSEGEGSMKRILCSLLVATLPFGSVLADAPKSKNAKVTLVYQHELPNVPGKSIKGALVEYGPGGYSPGHKHPKSAFVLEGGDPQSGQRRTGDDLRGRTEFLELPGDRHSVSANRHLVQRNEVTTKWRRENAQYARNLQARRPSSCTRA